MSGSAARPGLDPRLQWQKDLSRDSDLPAHARHVAMVLASSLDYWLRGKVALVYLMASTGHGRRHVSEALQLLKEAGWIEVERARAQGRSTMYRATYPAMIRRSEVHQSAPHPPISNVHPGAHQTPPNVHPGAHQTPPEVHQGAPVLSTRERKDENYVRTPSQAEKPLTTLAEVPKPGRDEVAVDQVLAELATTRLKPKTPGEANRLQGLIRQRLTAGVTATEILEDASTVTIDPFSVPGMFASTVRHSHLELYDGPRRPDWCGACDESTRLLEVGDGMKRCPDCHPLSLAVAMAR